MKIVHVSTGGAPIPPQRGGGVEAYILIASKRHVASGHTVHVLDRRHHPGGPDVEDLDGVNVVRLDARRGDLSFFQRFISVTGLALLDTALNQLFFAVAAKRYLDRAPEPDVIVVHTTIIGWVLVVLRGIWIDKVIYASHSARRFSHTRSLVDRLAVVLENRLVRYLKKAIFSVESAQDQVVKATGLRREQIAIIPDNCPELDFFSAYGIDPQLAADRYQLQDKIVVLFVGRIRENKGVEYLVRAAADIVGTFGHRDVCFLLVGPVEDFGAEKYAARHHYLQRVVSLVQSHELQKHVMLLGEVPVGELGSLYAASDIFVLPSLFEASPKAVLEAMAFGIPVVTTRVGMLPQAIEDGYNGFLVQPGDVDELTQKIVYLIEHPGDRATMGANARRKAEVEFNWDRVAQRMVEAYYTLTASPG